MSIAKELLDRSLLGLANKSNARVKGFRHSDSSLGLKYSLGPDFTYSSLFICAHNQSPAELHLSQYLFNQSALHSTNPKVIHLNPLLSNIRKLTTSISWINSN